MSTQMFAKLLLAGAVAAAGLGLAAWGHFTLPLGVVSLGSDVLGLLVFAGGVLFGYRTIKAHFDALEAPRG
jgi:uncharacterized integral membrane protein